MTKDPRGPLKLIMKVENGPDTNGAWVTKLCGHRSKMAQHFDYKIGNYIHCFECGPNGKAWESTNKEIEGENP